MSLLGARMFEGNKSEGESVGGDAHLCGLGAIVASLNDSISRVLQLAQWWVEGGQAVPAPNAAGAAGDGGVTGVGFAMNTDLAARALSGDLITALVGAWRKGALGRESLLEKFKRGEVFPEGRTVAQERALIHGS